MTEPSCPHIPPLTDGGIRVTDARSELDLVEVGGRRGVLTLRRGGYSIKRDIGEHVFFRGATSLLILSTPRPSLITRDDLKLVLDHLAQSDGQGLLIRLGLNERTEVVELVLLELPGIGIGGLVMPSGCAEVPSMSFFPCGGRRKYLMVTGTV